MLLNLCIGLVVHLWCRFYMFGGIFFEYRLGLCDSIREGLLGVCLSMGTKDSGEMFWRRRSGVGFCVTLTVSH